MSTYVMSDIHGCFNEFMRMLDKIHFTENDRMIIAGDYIDRGPDSDKMLDFICEHIDEPKFIFLKGNHDEELDCTFYDIDCGGVYGHPKSNFVAMRLEDEKSFHLY